MKRTLYIVFIAALTVIASCTKQSAGDAPTISGSSNSYIFFEPEVHTATTKAATLVEGNQLPSAATTAFGVLGYYGTTDLFNGVREVKRNGEGGQFEYQGLVAWQDNTTPHDFYAIYPYDEFSSFVTTEDYPKFLYTQPIQLTGQSDAEMIDVLTAHTSIQKTDDNNVSLTFHHRLWALDVEIKNSQVKGVGSNGTTVSDKPSLIITGIKLYISEFPAKVNIPLDPSQPITYPTGVQPITPTEPYRIPLSALVADNTISYNQTKTFGTLLFIPVPAGTFKYRLVINYKDSRGVDAEFAYPSKDGYQPSSVAFEGGKVYSLTVNKKDDVFVFGEFDNSGDWTDVTVPHTFN